ncbi:MAG: hypothetical protein IJO99_02115 [Ruminococcus sp.]|nr:hypothetical protein [Ruminococcus sp.]
MYREYIKQVINKAVDSVCFADLNECCEKESEMLLLKIAEILKSESDDFACVEGIINIMENAGFDCGCRHDF